LPWCGAEFESQRGKQGQEARREQATNQAATKACLQASFVAPLPHFSTLFSRCELRETCLDLFYKELRCPSLDAALAFEEK